MDAFNPVKTQSKRKIAGGLHPAEKECEGSPPGPLVDFASTDKQAL